MANAAAVELSISPEKLGFIITKAREFDVKDVVTDPGDSSNATDDAMLSVLEDHPDDPVAQELAGFIRALTEDEQIDLVALTWLGRGDGGVEDWADLRAEASRAHNRRTASYSAGDAAAVEPLGRCALAVRHFIRGAVTGGPSEGRESRP